jgi:putative IMPACT (imprinted ancient) family translation regulator
MAVLRGSGLGDVCVVVTRYFGGTLLGTGGLVRAYGDAVKAVLAELPRGEKVERRVLHLRLPYSLYEPMRLLVEEHGATVEEQQFDIDVRLQVRVDADHAAGLVTALIEQSGARVVVTQAQET